MGYGIMTKNKQTCCDACGKKRITSEVDGNAFCSECEILTDAIQNNANLLKKIAELTNATCCSSKKAPESSLDLPDVLDAVRYKTRDREMNTWYVSVSEQDGEPVEIFASTAFDRDHHLQSRISNLTTITRLISLILRNVFLQEKLTLEKTISQLNKSSRQRNDLPDMLTRVLSNYAKKNSSQSDNQDCD